MENDATPVDLAELTSRAASAQKAFIKLSVRKRLRVIRDLRHRLVERWRELAGAVEADIGRPIQEVLASDILPTASACRFLENNAGRILRPVKVPRGRRPIWLWGDHETIYRQPRGTVGIIGTWNYPVFLNVVQIAQALTAGNAVLWKPSEVVPHTTEKLSAILGDIGLPPGLFVTLPAARKMGRHLADADIDHIVFTGSAEVGRKLAIRLGERLISSTLELSGCDAMFVMADADVELAAKSAWFGMTLNGGQTCLAVRRVFVNRQVLEPFLAWLRTVAETKNAPVRLALPTQRQQADRLVREAIATGARRLIEFPAEDGNSNGFRPTVLLDAKPDMAVCREAVFAPVMAILPYETVEEAVGMDAECPFALGASIFSRHEYPATQLARRLRAGVVTINDAIVPTAHPATPFGGRKQSGWGVTQGAEGLLEMTEPQVIGIRSGSFRPHLDPKMADDPEMLEILEGTLRSWYGGGIRQRVSGIMQQVRSGWRQWKGKKEQ